MKWCWAQELVKGNPLDVVDHLLPQQPGKRERTRYQPSMPWRDIPAFVKGVLHASASNVTRALLEFVILSAARSGEARAMTWHEVDLEAKAWTVTANRMKAKVSGRNPQGATPEAPRKRTCVSLSEGAGIERYGPDGLPTRSEGAQ